VKGKPIPVVDEKARFPSEAIELVKEAKFEATDAAANDPFSLPSGQGTRTKSADRELKTELIVRLHDDLDGSMPVVLGKLPLGALRRGVRVVKLMTVKSRTAHASDSEWSELCWASSGRTISSPRCGRRDYGWTE
jgi:hypothetical protein